MSVLSIHNSSYVEHIKHTNLKMNASYNIIQKNRLTNTHTHTQYTLAYAPKNM